MKRNYRITICSFGFCCLFATSSFGSGIINKQGYSADYYRTLNRVAATDGVDAVAYNPAGVMKLENGFHTRADVQYVGKTYSNDVPGYGLLETDEPSIVPSLFALYKEDCWAGYFAITVPGGGGSVDYPDGNARTVAIVEGLKQMGFQGASSMSLEAMTTYVGFTAGGAYAINDMVSMSLGLRYIYAYQEFTGSISAIGASGNTDFLVDMERDAQGIGGIFGLNISPNENVNIAMRYETSTKIDLKSSVASDDLGIMESLGMEDGTTQREDLPGLISIGAYYKPTPKWKVETSFTYYLEDEATWEAQRLQGAGNSWEAGIAVEYEISSGLKLSLGYLYNELEISADLVQPENPLLDNQTLGAGAMWAISDRINVSFGLFKTFYKDETTSSGVTYSKDALCGALGFEYHF